MANNNQIYKFSNAGGFKSLNRYYDMLAGNAVWNPWEPQGAYDALSTITVPSGGVASVTFAGIPNTYKHLQVRCSTQTNRATYGSDVLNLQLNNDSSASYTNHRLYGDGASALASWSTGATGIDLGGTLSGVINAAGTSIIDILDYANTNKYRTVRALGGGDHNGLIAGFPGIVNLSSGLYLSTTAVSSIKIYPIYGTAFNQHSQFTLYGIR